MGIFLLFFLSIVFLYSSSVLANNNPENKSLIDLKNETLSYFEPTSGKIIAIDNDNLIIEIRDKKSINVGTRLNAFK
ncbi:MAG: hypothetical protein N3A59_09375, partial [Thermodesulfovibrionales bacterium]|nr:hypothetical protein [Thermodesulfovibrionales bacterium]